MGHSIHGPGPGPLTVDLLRFPHRERERSVATSHPGHGVPGQQHCQRTRLKSLSHLNEPPRTPHPDPGTPRTNPPPSTGHPGEEMQPSTPNGTPIEPDRGPLPKRNRLPTRTL